MEREREMGGGDGERNKEREGVSTDYRHVSPLSVCPPGPRHDGRGGGDEEQALKPPRQ